MRDIIYGVLVKFYGRMYGYDLCEAMTEHIANRINDGTFLTRGDIMNYVWCNTSGGGVAEAASGEIQAALPAVVQDTMGRSHKGKVA